MKNKLFIVFVGSFGVLSAFNEPKQSIHFTENKGQVSDQNYKPRPDVLFSGSINGMVYNLKNSGISYQLYKVESWREDKIDSKKTDETIRVPAKTTIYRLDVNWLNTNRSCVVQKSGAQEGYDNYYLESCPNGVVNVKYYSDIIYKNIYKGIDLHYYGKENGLKYDYIVHPFSDYKKIKFEIKGAESISVKNGELIIKTPLGEISEEAPIVYQNGIKINARWIIKNNIVSFEIGKYDPYFELVIDPAVRVWGTYYTGGQAEAGLSCSTDASGNVFLTGQTASNTTTLIATSGSHQTTFVGGSWDGFLVKFNSAGVRQWATYYGAFGSDYPYGSAIDGSGNVYICGMTQSPNAIATTGSHQSSYGGGMSDAFLVKFNTNGVRQWGTYYGGAGDETGYSCSVDGSGNAFLTGVTSTSVGTSVATPGSHQSIFGGNLFDGFLVKFNSAGTRQWGTYYGSNQQEYSYSCTNDGSGNVYITGEAGSSVSTEIATAGSHQSSFGGGTLDAYLVKFNTSGVRQWGTYYGGTGGERGYSCVTFSNSVYLVGPTTTTVAGVIATASVFQPNFSGGCCNDAYLVQFDGSGVRQWGTYYGGSNGDDFGWSCTVDASGNPYIYGNTSSTVTGVIATAGAHQTVWGGNVYDAFLVSFDVNGNRISGTYYGGTGIEYAKGCCADLFGNVYITGYSSTSSGTAIATPGSYQSVSVNPPLNNTAYLVKFFECNAAPPPPSDITPVANLIFCEGSATTLNVSGVGNINWYATSNSTVVLATGANYNTPTLSAGTYTYYAEANTCTVSPTRTSITLTVNPNPTVTASTPSAVCAGSVGCLSANGALSYNWAGPCGFSSMLQNPCFPFSGSCMCTYTVFGIDANSCLNTATVCINVIAPPGIAANSTNSVLCVGQTATITSIGGSSTYTWNTSATGSVIVVSPTITTTYSVTGTAPNGCTNGTSITQTVSTCAGIDEDVPGNEFKVYPNPTNGEFQIILGNSIEDAELKIYNAIGEMIITRKLFNPENKIDLNEFADGVYLLKIFRDKQLINQEKIVKTQ